jgi:hypothetical protein
LGAAGLTCIRDKEAATVWLLKSEPVETAVTWFEVVSGGEIITPPIRET